MALGWLTRECKEEDWQDLLRQYAGENFRKFDGPQVSLECWLNADDDDAPEEEKVETGEDDEDEYSELTDHAPVTVDLSL